MPIPKQLVTGSMVIATLVTAAGLNLGVMSIGNADLETTAGSVSAGGVSAEGASAAEEVGSTESALGVAVDAAEAESQDQQTAVLNVVAALPSPKTAAVGRSTGASSTPTESSTTSANASSTLAQSFTASTESSTTSAETSSTMTNEQLKTTSTPAATATTANRETSTTLTQPVTTDSEPPTSAPVVHSEYITYEFDGVASIIIALHDGERLEFWSAATAPGWVYRVDDDDHDLVKIKFRPLDGGDEAEFVVKLDDGEIKVKKEY